MVRVRYWSHYPGLLIRWLPWYHFHSWNLLGDLTFSAGILAAGGEDHI